MKKILLGTSALIGALAISGVAHAGGSAAGGSGGPSASVGGFIDFQAGWADQDNAYEAAESGLDRDYHFTNDAEIHFAVEGKSNSGIEYGAVIELNTNVDADPEGDSGAGNADKTYIWVKSSAGEVELGNNGAAAESMKVDAASIARATGGIDGDWQRFVDLDGTAGGSSIGAQTSAFIVRSTSPSAANFGTKEDASKISYYTPRFYGVQGGVSFTPDEGDVGTAAGLSSETGTDQENVWSLGVNYKRTYNDINIAASLTGEFGSSEVATTEDVNAWAIGASAESRGVSVAASYGSWGDSGLATTTTGEDSQTYWTLGAAYATGPYGVSATYLQSDGASGGAGSRSMELSNLSLGADYKLAPGLVPYVEVNFFDTDDNSAATTDNDGTVVLIGTQLNF